MTVAAVMLFRTVETALADAAGRPAVRRMVETAWAGGATPIVVLSFDRDGTVAIVLAGSPAVLAEPAPLEQGALGQVLHGIRLAAGQVSGTDAALVWPGRMAWVDAETVTSLIEAHGGDPDTLLRPAYAGQPGLPVLVPLARTDELAAVAPGDPRDDVLIDISTAGVATRTIEVGDPGVIHDIAVALDSLPVYEGPPEPVTGPPPEWGAAAADAADEGPLEGPALAPYAQAADPEADWGVDAAVDPVELLRDARTVLLIDWPSRDVPDTLARAGLDVVSAEGRDLYNAYRAEGDAIHLERVDGPPSRVDLVYAHRPIDELAEIVDQARALGARGLWLQSGIDSAGKRDPRGCWLPAEHDVLARHVVESAGLGYVREPYIVDAARALGREDDQAD